jgi:hypothetical protein
VVSVSVRASPGKARWRAAEEGLSALGCTVFLELSDTATVGRTIRVCYTATDLSTAASANATARFLSTAPSAVLLKASLFAMRDARFASLADAIIRHAALLLQDEAGFPWSRLQALLHMQATHPMSLNSTTRTAASTRDESVVAATPATNFLGSVSQYTGLSRPALARAHVALFGNYTREATFQGAGTRPVDESLLDAFRRRRGHELRSLPFRFGYSSMLVLVTFLDRGIRR